ncbi:Chaperone protein DnaJ [Commensalibacter sp. Nvir]|uniref:DnaJ C-terminal domain-containing protein n=1 Tax=Commensalibacter sp. Nvir TaxID=3069817 RepID=UPI002D2C8C8D|nr:Chaperone protein DnaJ [Commensalibacter sp. Nvir]
MDPYKLLGVPKNSSQEEIRKAYRDLAKKYHPDLNPGDKKAEEQFKLIGVANDLLSDPEKRARFDRGEIDIHGQEQGFANGAGYRHYADGTQGFRYNQHAGNSQFSEEDLQNIFSMFGAGASGEGFTQQSNPFGPRHGQDKRYTLEIDFLDAVNGAKSRITLPGGGTLDVKIPLGIEDGQVLRLRGKGDPGIKNAPPGDALITVHIRPHPHFKKEGRNIRLNCSVPLKTAVLGGKLNVMTPQGEVSLNIPPHSDTGSILRLRGRGFPAKGTLQAGDLYVQLQVSIGKVDKALEDFLRNQPDGNQ